MLNLIERHKAEIASICRRFHVRRLDVFGSAARGGDFDTARSDVDLLVTYLPGHPPDIAAYQDLRDALADLLERPVDLVRKARWRTRSSGPASNARVNQFMQRDPRAPSGMSARRLTTLSRMAIVFQSLSQIKQLPEYIKTDSNKHRKHFPDGTREGITGAIRRRFRGWHQMASAAKSES